MILVKLWIYVISRAKNIHRRKINMGLKEEIKEREKEKTA